MTLSLMLFKDIRKGKKEMNVGLSNLITVDGKNIKVFWNTFDPNKIAGKNLTLAFYSERVRLESLDDYTPVIKDVGFNGRFHLAKTDENVETYVSTCKVVVNPPFDSRIKTVIFYSDGIPWSMCEFEEFVHINARVETIFSFETNLIINNMVGIATNPWSGNIGKFLAKYAVKITATDKRDGVLWVLKNTFKDNKPTDEQIVQAINKEGIGMLPSNFYVDDKFHIHITSTKENNFSGVKAIFIRILWNIGILIYVDEVSFDGTTLDNLTIVSGQEVRFSFGLKFTEIKNVFSI